MEQPELFGFEDVVGPIELSEASREARGRSVAAERRKNPKATVRIFCVDWNALIRGRTHPGERCELRGIGAVSVTEMRRTLLVSSARLVVTDDNDRVVTVALLGTGAINGRIIPTGKRSGWGDGRIVTTETGLWASASSGNEPSSTHERAMEPGADRRPAPSTVIIRVRSADLGWLAGMAAAAGDDAGPTADDGERWHGGDSAGMAMTNPVVEIRGLGLVDRDRALALLGAEALTRLTERGIAVRQHIHPGRGPSAAQRIALAWADTTCKVAGCTNQRVEIDHRDPWAALRVTELDNLDPLCAHHHGLKSNRGWAFTGTDGTTFESPSRRSKRGG